MSQFFQLYFLIMFYFILALSVCACLDCHYSYTNKSNCGDKKPKYCPALPYQGILLQFYETVPLKCVFLGAFNSENLQVVMLIGVIVSYFSLIYVATYLLFNYSSIKDSVLSLFSRKYTQAANVVERAARPKIYIIRPPRESTVPKEEIQSPKSGESIMS